MPSSTVMPWRAALGWTAAALHLVASAARAEMPSVDGLLRRAGAVAATMQARLPVTVAREEYRQELLLGWETFPRQRRTLVSDVFWVPTGDGMVWAFYRDVVSADGVPVADRALRLDRLFSAGATVDAHRQAARLLEESARYNLGRRRTINTPTFGLSLLHPRNQARFRFRIAGTATIDGARVLKVRFDEVQRPTLTRTSTGMDVPARGTLKIEPERGALVESELQFVAPTFPAVIKVRYREQGRLGAWLPVEMQESYGRSSPVVTEERIKATATYSGFRSADVTVHEVETVP